MIVFINAGCSATSVYFLREQTFEDNSGIVIDVPFIKQGKDLCGPAALEAVLAYWGKSCSQEQIAKSISKPGLKGVLNIDLEQYARKQGLWAKGTTGDFETLKKRLLSGVPVIVLEKLHPFILNRMHYCVVVGFSQKHKIIIEHTGTKEFVLRSYQGFKRNWYAGGNWMLEVVPFEKVGDSLSEKDNIELGIVLEQHKLFDQALKRYNEALRLDPDNALVLYNIGNVYLHLEDWDNAENAYIQAITQEEHFGDAFNNLAYVYLKRKEYDQALKFIDKALAINSNKHFYYLDTKAQILFAQNRIEEAVQAFQQAKNNQQHVPDEILTDFYRFWREKFQHIGREWVIDK